MCVYNRWKREREREETVILSVMSLALRVCKSKFRLSVSENDLWWIMYISTMAITHTDYFNIYIRELLVIAFILHYHWPSGSFGFWSYSRTGFRAWATIDGSPSILGLNRRRRGEKSATEKKSQGSVHLMNCDNIAAFRIFRSIRIF